jgi:uncharacterized DUF497 family protein
MEFEWDLRKESENIRKHRVSFLEAIETFSDPNGFVMKDVKHSHQEARYYWVGRSRKDRILTTRYTRRGNKIRLIGSAEWREFRRLYYEKTKDE